MMVLMDNNDIIRCATLPNGFVRYIETRTDLSREIFDHGVCDAKGRVVGSLMNISSISRRIDPDGAGGMPSSDIAELGITVEGATIYRVYTVPTRDGECFGGGRPAKLEFATHGEALAAGTKNVKTAKARAVKRFG